MQRWIGEEMGQFKKNWGQKSDYYQNTWKRLTKLTHSCTSLTLYNGFVQRCVMYLTCQCSKDLSNQREKRHSVLALVICNTEFIHLPRHNRSDQHIAGMLVLPKKLRYYVHKEMNLTAKANTFLSTVHTDPYASQLFYSSQYAHMFTCLITNL